MFYGGTGCFHRRKVIYGVPPEPTSDVQQPRMRGEILWRTCTLMPFFSVDNGSIKKIPTAASPWLTLQLHLHSNRLYTFPGSPSYKELQKMFGSSKELIESARSIMSVEMFAAAPAVDLASRIDAAKEVSSCDYEAGTSWGQEV
jgi:hypothetical protein